MLQNGADPDCRDTLLKTVMDKGGAGTVKVVVTLRHRIFYNPLSRISPEARLFHMPTMTGLGFPRSTT